MVRLYNAIAALVSDILSPPIVASCFAVGFFAYVAPGTGRVTTWYWLAFTLPLVLVPPLAYTFWLVRCGELTDIHMPNRQARLKPLSIIVAWLFICAAMFHYWGAPHRLMLLLRATFLLGGTLTVVTRFWKISYHSATISAVAAVAVSLGGIKIGIVIIFLVPLVGWARIHLGRHTLLQVVGGSLAGVLSAMAMLAYL
jgi:membrane-associated phospholipid phosphatase